MGPVGSSKSSACCIDLFLRSCAQAPFNRVRETKFFIIRNTYAELITTTLETWKQWFPFAKISGDSPIISSMEFPLPDKTVVRSKALFFPVDRPEEIKKLKSLEGTMAWMNEAGEMSKAVLDMCTQRVGRYPPQKRGGPSFSGVIMDTNPPDDDHWYYRLAEQERPKDYVFFRQPGALKLEGGEYVKNELAENIANLPGGYEYYFRQIPGKSRDWIKVFILGNYGAVIAGRPVYPEYRDETHCKPILPTPGIPLILGFDFGLTPACVITQLSRRGQFRILKELFVKDMGIRQFTRDVVKPFLAENFRGYAIQAAGDPAGVARADTDERTCFMELAEEGIPCVPAISNAFVGRREAVARYLTRMADGEPSLLVDPSCDMIRRGFNGRYQYKRVQVSGEERFRDAPDKNDFSHPHDALQYAAMHSQAANLDEAWGKPIDYPKSGIV